ncbi:TPA: hypothetical protein ACH3X1_015971 [Trebouxia sp. C0004]
MLIDKMDSTLGINIWMDARKVLQRIAGKDLGGLVTIQLTMLQVNGLGDVQVGAELTKKRALPDTIGCHTFEYDSTYRRAVWLPQGHLGKEYKALDVAAMRVLSLHATSCAPERNWGVSDPDGAAEAARKAIQTAQLRSRRAAEQAADTAARSAARLAIHKAASARQATPCRSHLPAHPRHRVATLGTAGMFLGLLTSPFVDSLPLWQDHLHVSQSEAQPFGPDFSSPAPQQADITSASFVTPGNQSTSGQLLAPIAPEYRDIGALPY